MGKTGRKNKVYSPEFKINVIMDMREHNLGYNETIRKYWDDGLVSNHFQQIKLWERLYLEEGAEGLMKERRGRTCKATGTRKGRPPKEYIVSEQDKVAELKYILARKDAKIKSLEMENELMRDFLSLTERK